VRSQLAFQYIAWKIRARSPAAPSPPCPPRPPTTNGPPQLADVMRRSTRLRAGAMASHSTRANRLPHPTRLDRPCSRLVSCGYINASQMRRCELPHTSAVDLWLRIWRAHTSPLPWARLSLRP
jgi:hypothetical protein